jgi:hypothetical protein
MDTGRLTVGGPVDRSVSIKHISEFKRMRHFSPFSAIVSALRDSKDLVVVGSGGLQALSRPEIAVL